MLFVKNISLLLGLANALLLIWLRHRGQTVRLRPSPSHVTEKLKVWNPKLRRGKPRHHVLLRAHTKDPRGWWPHTHSTRTPTFFFFYETTLIRSNHYYIDNSATDGRPPLPPFLPCSPSCHPTYRRSPLPLTLVSKSDAVLYSLRLA